MSENDLPVSDSRWTTGEGDVAAHMAHEPAQTPQDVEGHGVKRDLGPADQDADAAQDVEGHGFRQGLGPDDEATGEQQDENPKLRLD